MNEKEVILNTSFTRSLDNLRNQRNQTNRRPVNRNTQQTATREGSQQLGQRSLYTLYNMQALQPDVKLPAAKSSPQAASPRITKTNLAASNLAALSNHSSQPINNQIFSNQVDTQTLNIQDQSQTQSQSITQTNSITVIDGIHDFQALASRLQQETLRAVRYHRPLALAVVSFPNLYALTRSHDVSAYQAALAFAARSMALLCDADVDIIGYLSSEKIVLLLPERGEEVIFLAERIGDFFEKYPFSHWQHLIQLVPSIGLSMYPNHGTNWQELIARADLAADSVVERGGNGYTFGPVPQ